MTHSLKIICLFSCIVPFFSPMSSMEPDLVTLQQSLLDAAKDGDEPTVIQLVGKGVDVNATNEDRTETALSYAVRNGHTQIARFLLGHGALVYIPHLKSANPKVLFPLAVYAVEQQNYELLALLLKYRVSTSATVKREEQYLSAIDIATLNGDIKAIEMLLEHGSGLPEHLFFPLTRISDERLQEETERRIIILLLKYGIEGNKDLVNSILYPQELRSNPEPLSSLNSRLQLAASTGDNEALETILNPKIGWVKWGFDICKFGLARAAFLRLQRAINLINDTGALALAAGQGHEGTVQFLLSWGTGQIHPANPFEALRIVNVLLREPPPFNRRRGSYEAYLNISTMLERAARYWEQWWSQINPQRPAHQPATVLLQLLPRELLQELRIYVGFPHK
jgi:ankyrin repeat protein